MISLFKVLDKIRRPKSIKTISFDFDTMLWGETLSILTTVKVAWFTNSTHPVYVEARKVSGDGVVYSLIHAGSLASLILWEIPVEVYGTYDISINVPGARAVVRKYISGL